MNKVLLNVGRVAIVLAGVIALFLMYISFNDYKPEEVERADVYAVNPTTIEANKLDSSSSGNKLTLVTLNVGFCGSGASSQFVSEGGQGNGSAGSTEVVNKNLDGIVESLRNQGADVYMLQEVDTDSGRSEGINEMLAFSERLGGRSYAFAFDMKVPFTLNPTFTLSWPVGGVKSGIMTISTQDYLDMATRESLPTSLGWPAGTMSAKRCALVTYLDVPGTLDQVALINFHLEPFTDQASRLAQAKKVLEIAERERAAGYYVICAGDWNELFPGSTDVYPVKSTSTWVPGNLTDLEIPSSFQLAYSNDTPTRRLLNQAYDAASAANQYYVVDGFLVSNDVKVESVSVVNDDFQYTDHNAVKLVVSFK